jgi:polyketide biosynthesis acyl carrier protein
VIAACARDVMPDLVAHEFQSSDRLVELGANSLDRAEIVVRTLEVLDLDVPRSALVRLSNVGELADVLYEKLRAR